MRAISMEKELTNKIIYGLERISEVFKTLLWEKAKLHGMSPIQIQILLFISGHAPALCNVSHLAREFDVTKPTISDAVKALLDKGHVQKGHSSSDNRSFSLQLSSQGVDLVHELQDYAFPLQQQLGDIAQEDLITTYNTLTKIIYQLNRSGILTVQRVCFGCRFYEKLPNSHYCNLLQKPLKGHEIRLDCAEFEAETAHTVDV
jgi:DNA-binding MarR family transcriptional regulator